MGSSLKKVFSSMLMAALWFSALNAGMDVDSDDCCQPKVEPCYGYAYNPGVFIADCCGWTANIAYLYWKPSQEGISSGTINSLEEGTTNPITTPPDAFDFLGNVSAQQVYPRFEWDSGFRIGAGYHLPCDSWVVGLEYTHYRTDTYKNYASAFTDTSGGEYPTGITGTVFSPAYSATFDSADALTLTQVSVGLDWRMEYNQVDLDFTRQFYVARWMTVKPHAGLRALFMYQNYNIQKNGSGFDPFVLTSLGSVAQSREILTMDNNFKGVGLEGGLDMSFDLGCDLSFYGELGAGATFGRFRTTQRVNSTFQFGATSLSTTESINYRVTDNHDTVLYNADLAFGIRWSQKVNGDQSLLSINFGYEEHIFFDYNRFRNLLGSGLQNALTNSPSGNLSFYGIVVGAAIDF